MPCLALMQHSLVGSMQVESQHAHVAGQGSDEPEHIKQPGPAFGAQPVPQQMSPTE